jgi:hypothetical protein
MLCEIQECQNLDVSEFEITERCYWIAWEYYLKLKEVVQNAPFKNESEEIEFFKAVKPQFTSYMEFFINLLEILPLVEDYTNNAVKLWKEEMLRYGRFYRKNQEFIEYLDNGSTEMDRTYFLRSENKMQNDSVTLVFDADIQFRTSHDGLVRSIMAFKMYMEYIRKKLDQL